MPRRTNHGYCPRDAEGKRIHATLFSGTDTREKSPQGWAADGKWACNWSISTPPHPFEIQFYEVI